MEFTDEEWAVIEDALRYEQEGHFYITRNHQRRELADRIRVRSS